MTKPQDALDETFVDGLYGKHTHVHPTTALSDLPPSLARKRPSDDTHSCWEILHHMVIWQDYTIKMLRGEKMDWRDISKIEWPSKDDLADDDGWEKLVARFSSGIAELEEIIRTIDLSKSVPTLPEGPSGAWILVIVQHNSYHIGQIVVVRTLLDRWPPSKTDD
ncbi:MAG: DinB family protein [Candidatus Thorarchaeota archaeon]|jgi:uncharacterized damage-inducible protein DinB